MFARKTTGLFIVSTLQLKQQRNSGLLLKKETKPPMLPFLPTQ